MSSVFCLLWAAGCGGGKKAECGDGVVEGEEECDDGNTSDTDGCTTMCLEAYCGDGFVHEGVEECDDGNDIDYDGCTNDCRLPRCGDGILQEGEECDDGNWDDNDACTNSCTVAVCGDGVVWFGREACDDGNDIDDDGCTSDCALPSCGDGIVQAGEECDDGNLSNADDCLTTCLAASCGDGFVQEGVEECDDGNLVDGDWCSAGCQKECLLGDVAELQGGNCYVVVAEMVSWGEAAQACELIGSHLVSIGDDAENTFVQGLLDGVGPSAWLGLTDQWSEGSFVWFIGPGQVLAPVFLNWAAAQPDNQPGDAADCAMIDAAEGAWYDQQCGEQRAYVCEHEWQ